MLNAEQLAIQAKRLEEARRQAIRLEGIKDELEREEKALRSSIALAKGRLGLKDEVNDFLERVQSAMYSKLVGDYGDMLTGAMHDVLASEQDHRIVMELETKSGAPALDIFKVRHDGRYSDIFEKEGGALTNIVSIALRVIATAKSNKRRFILLDEPDCWAAPENVPAIFMLLQRIAKNLKMQIFVITHHSLSSLGNDVNFLEAVGSYENGIRIARKASELHFKDDEEGIRRIRIKNHSSFADATFDLSPGLNVFFGPNNIGKSRIARAIRGAVYGHSDDDDVRNPHMAAEVEFTLEKGKTVKWSRKPKRAAADAEAKKGNVTNWRMTDADGNVIDINGVRCETGGKAVPEWVGHSEALGIEMIQDLDVQISHQKRPVFLLEESASKRAALLQIGNEADLLRTMISEHKARCSADQATIRSGEPKMALLMERLAALEGLVRVNLMLTQADELLSNIQVAMGQSQLAAGLIRRIESAVSKKKMLEEGIAIVGELPNIPAPAQLLDDAKKAKLLADKIETIGLRRAKIDEALSIMKAFPATVPVFPEMGQATLLAEKIEGAKNMRLQREAELALLAEIPQPPELPELGAAAAAAHRIESSNNAAAAALKEVEMAHAAMKDAEAEIAEIMLSLGGTCPVCGTHGINHQHILKSEAA